MAYGYYASITIDHTQCGSSDSSSFPVLVKLSSTNLKTVANGGKVQNSSGYDIVFGSDDAGASLYNWEMVKYDGTAGTVEAWVNVPTVTHGSNTGLYLVLGNSAISTFQGGSAGTAWNSGYKHVVHCGDGTTLNLNDSTAGGTNGTNSGGAAGSGQVGGGFAVTAGEYYTTAGNLANIVGGSTKHSIEMWVYQTTQSSTNYIWDLDVGSGIGAFCNLSNGSLIQWGYGGGGGYRSYTIAMSTGTWYHLAFEKSAAGDNGDLYINGVRQATYTGTLGDPNASATPGGQFGAYHASSSVLCLDGKIDETRISNTNRGADWYLTAYNNQVSPGDFGSPGFYTMGTLTALPVSTTVTKGLQYAVVTKTAVTKSLQYEVKGNSTITKSLQYCIPTKTTLTKSLEYTVKTATAITKSLQYAIKGHTTITKGLQYEVNTANAIMKGLQYEVLTHTTITKGLQYEILTSTHLTKGLQYSVKTVTTLTKGLAYSISVPKQITKALQYVLSEPHTLTKALGYRIVIPHTIQKSLFYFIEQPPVITSGKIILTTANQPSVLSLTSKQGAIL